MDTIASDGDIVAVVQQYCYLDLEVTAEQTIAALGWLSATEQLKLKAEASEIIYGYLKAIHSQQALLCGHNLRRFDCRYVYQRWPDLADLLVIDTLELSVLAFPLANSHRLQKAYKHSDYASNDPLEDVLATRQLLVVIVQALADKPLALRQLWVWLLTCGASASDRAYAQFFAALGWLVTQPPAPPMVPAPAIQGMDRDYLAQVWQPALAATLDPELRLCLAALLAWNYERQMSQHPVGYALWLQSLPMCPTALNALWPVGFTYQPYLSQFGLEGFRGEQEAAIQAILAGENPLIVMPTGGGKSLCYQLPALMLYQRQWALTVCISPLQALMADQVADLEQAGLTFATFINGSLLAPERRQRLEAVRQAQKGLLYISPEQLRSLSIRTLLQERLPVLWVVDEAHCISQWGHDFRPDYRYLPKFMRELYADQERPLPRMALVTATATARVRQDIVTLFGDSGLPIARTLVAPNQRPNLHYEIVPVRGHKEPLLLAAVEGAVAQQGCALVYTTTRKQAEQLATRLQQANLAAACYHGQLTREEKAQVLTAFKQGELQVVAATCAFGMGINRADVRAVIHYTLSDSLEAYSQEVGRAGRDQLPATCTLLFDEQDAETIFFLRSLNQLTLTDLRHILLAVRSVRDQLKAGSDWFWVSGEEIFQRSDLTEKLATDPNQRETKIRVALYYLESFGLLERAENLSTAIQVRLLQAAASQSWQHFQAYAQRCDLSRLQRAQFEKLIYALHLMQMQHQGERLALEQLSDEAGLPLLELPDRLRELQRAGVCTTQIPLILLVTKGVVGDTHNVYQRRCQLEQQLLETLVDLVADRATLQINLRALATRLDPDQRLKLSANQLLAILTGWQALGWLQLQSVHTGIVRLQGPDAQTGPCSRVMAGLPHQQTYCEQLIAYLYTLIEATAERKVGARLVVECEFEHMLADLCQPRTPTPADAHWLRLILCWLHQQKIVRLADGLTLFSQALKLRLVPGARIDAIDRHYPTLMAHYQQQAHRTHLMIGYGRLAARPDASQQLLADYFDLSAADFAQSYPELHTPATLRPVTQQDYEQIMGPLNAGQREIVTAELPAMGVIAGPGSGKTRTIVHRIAYLVRVQRVSPDRIIVLAYNRNAVRELRLRLQSLLGALASQVRVHTFHGLALALLGRTLGEPGWGVGGGADPFADIIAAACERLSADSAEILEDDWQARRLELLGNTEYLFVDEYQDVAEHEYRFIQLIAGLNQAGDSKHSVQIKLCVIGDDDQNIYEFRGTSPQYILQFAAEYQAKRFLLTENYRSTEAIIAVANTLIQHNQERCKREAAEQVRIDAQRVGTVGQPVRALRFAQAIAQASWMTEQVRTWIAAGRQPGEIAILAYQWDDLKAVRALLERVAGIPTYSLKGREVKLVRQRTTQVLLEKLKAAPDVVLGPTESVVDRFTSFFEKTGRYLDEPTVKTLLKIAADLDQERGLGVAELATAISTQEIVTAIYEFNESPEAAIDETAVLVTSCHGAKGLEFPCVILLIDSFRLAQPEPERRLAYVALTRAKAELVVCATREHPLFQEMGLAATMMSVTTPQMPRFIYYADLQPDGVNLGYARTREHQARITQLREGSPLQLQVNRYGDNWLILDPSGVEMGALSRAAGRDLRKHRIYPGEFAFQPGEVTVRYVYHHLKVDTVTGERLEDWFVVIPQIRVCR